MGRRILTIASAVSLVIAASLLLVLSPLSEAANSEKDEQWHVVGTINGRARNAWLLQFSGDGKRLLAGFDDNPKPDEPAHVQLYDSHTLQPLTPLLPAEDWPAAQPWLSRDGQTVFAAAGKRLSAYDAAGKLRRDFPSGEAAASSGDGERVATVVTNHDPEDFTKCTWELTVWEVRTGKQLTSLHDTNWIERVAFLSAERLLVLEWWSQLERRYRVLNVATRKDVFPPIDPRLEGPMNWSPGCTPLAVSPDGNRFVVFDSGDDSDFIVYDSTGKKLIKSFTSGEVASAAFSSDGRVVLLARRRAMGLYDPVTGRPRGVQLLTRKGEEFDDRFALSPDGRFVTAYRRSAGVWDLETGELVLDLGRSATCAHAFSPDGRLAFMDGQGRITLWQHAGGR